MLDKYKEAYDEIEVPKELITETSLLMKEEQEKQAEKKKVGFFRRPVIFSLLGGMAAVILAIGILSQGGSSGELIKTELQAGKMVDKVKLENGELNFATHSISDNDLSSDLKSYITKAGSDADVKEFYGEIITIEVPKGFTNSQTKIECLYDGEQLTNVKVVNEYTKGDERIYVTYEKEDEGTLNTNSTIDKQELALRYNKVNEEFVAKYIDEGKLYSIKTENMTQEDFITFLVKFVK